MIQFSVATNFDNELLHQVAALNQQSDGSRITEIYGSLPMTITGGGRSPNDLPPITKENLQEHIRLAHQYDIKFNYLFNAPHPKIVERGILSQFDAVLDDLCQRGIDAVTLADKKLIAYVKSKYPDLDVHASLILGVDTADEAEELAQMGVSVITTNQFTINRYPARLQELVERVKRHSAVIRLYANISCLDHCPRAAAHYAFVGKSSQESERKQLHHDPFLVWCMSQYYDEPTRLLQTPFIRPEAISLYASLGIFNFKLSDRREKTPALMELYESYMKGRFDGNLFDLLFRYGRKWSNAVREREVGKPAIVIDNDALTKIDFDRNVLALQGEELTAFYETAARTAVIGVDSLDSLLFRERIKLVNL